MANNKQARAVARSKDPQSVDRQEPTLPLKKKIRSRNESSADAYHAPAGDEPAFADLRQRIADSLAGSRSGAPVDDGAVDRLLNLFVEQLKAQSALQSPQPEIIEPSLGVRFAVPPEARTTYAARASVYGAKPLLPEEFVLREWGDYTHYRLLYVEHLRQLDVSLYKACRHRARRLEISADDFFMGLGILTKRRVEHPPADVAWQASIINRSRALRLVEAANRSVVAARAKAARSQARD